MRWQPSAALAVVAAAAYATLVHAQNPDACAVGGRIAARALPLPGVVVTLVGADGQPIDISSSATDGTFALKAPAAGQYTLTAELVAFAPIAQALTLDAASCQQRVDLSMVLASRAPAPASVPAATPSTTSTDASPPATNGAGRAGRGGRGGRGGAPGGGEQRQAGTPGAGQVAPRQGGAQQFQSVELLADQAGLTRAGEADASGGDSAAQVLLPPGFSPETATETVATLGNATGNTNGNFFGGPDAFAQRFGGLGGAPGFGQAGGPGGPGGPGGFGPGGLGALGGPGGVLGRGRGNQLRGNVSTSTDTSALDSASFPLTGQPTTKPNYLQERMTATLGGPFGIPKILDSARTFFFLNYTGNHSRNPYDVYSTVPTLAERSGNLSALGQTIVNPFDHTKSPFPNDTIPGSMINPSATSLLNNLFPLPNQNGDVDNFHSVTTTTSQLDDINFRLVHSFSPPPPDGQRGGFGGGRGGGGGGRGGGGRGGSNLSIGIHFRHSENTNANPFPNLGGTTTGMSWDIPVNFSFTTAGMLHQMRFDYNRQHTETQSQFAFNQDVAGAGTPGNPGAGLLGVATDPFDWGAPGLSFTKFSSVNGIVPATSTAQTIAFGDTVVKTRGKHTFRMGGDYRDIRNDSRTDANANGSFVFTGLYTGSDLGDFLLGLPQQATVQYGPGLEQFRSRSWDLFLQDDWRATSKLTLNAGLRYEYYSPISEASNRLATLVASPGFTDAFPVAAGGNSSLSGDLPDSIVRPFARGFAPRVGLAWRIGDGTIFRTGYGINYNAAVYQSIAQQLAAQSGATVATVLATASNLVQMQQAFSNVTPGTIYNYGVDPNYRLPFVQIYNADLQRNLTRTVTVDIGYTGTKGTDLDVLSAPDRNEDGTLRIPNVPPFLWESSVGRSLMNSMTLSIRKRQSNGFGAGATYTLSKSMDDASSIGGGGTVVAQNPQDLGAEWGLSSFDQRHRFSGNVTIDLPFGEGKPWLTDGPSAALLGNWQLTGAVQAASGTPFTARILGNIGDVATGVNGTLRPDYNGQPIAIGDPTVGQFFNTGDFSLQKSGYGNAGRNTVIGPGTFNANLGVMRTITLGLTRVLSIQVMATNVFNQVQFASIDTNFSSRTFGWVTAARPMRRVQLVMRFRF